ncbi:MAG: bifunctional 23S rRNA (guanine(2069)-N(7))-methyltransferase RlmK/23S rRNA (guanine(2445)-N(2))-methyltransferase RlmL [Gammaproteobacteria bacterium]|nr:bifunctional 23S rRNA (guanine(2069)-N(7))-methyltransferase RlmK/23S rRNA (guanine(2445)-N(2))-methyltransferase RlmL [Gammaproteobacteria bacterium]
MKHSNQFFATCSKGIEDLVHTELEQLGITGLKIHTGGVAFTGEIEAAYKACLWSRVTSRILLQLKDFTIADDDDLYNEIISVDWSQHFSENNTLAIDCFSSHSEVTNSHFATLRVKDAIVDQFVQNTESRPSIEKDNPDIRLNVYLSDKQCLLYLDMSGEALHKRGYRLAAGNAPLRETLAASMLYRAKWKSFYEQGLPFYDPMCGSGTLLIEAAMMAADVAPGLLREKNGVGFGFSHWKMFDAEKWQLIVQQAEHRKQLGMQKIPAICGSDNNEILVGIARNNIDAAGMSAMIKVSLQDATHDLFKNMDFRCQRTPGLIVTNPPYGKRIGQVQLLRTLYHRFGAQLKSDFNGWTAVIITSEEELAKSIGLRAFRKNMLFNGALKSVLYQYRINESVGQASVNLPAETSTEQLTGQSAAQSTDERSDKTSTEQRSLEQAKSRAENEAENEAENQTENKVITEHGLMFANRLKKNYKHLKKWARKNNVSCYRVYDADIPQYAVAIDKYENWVHVQEYQAPKTIDKNRAFLRVNDVIDVVADILETSQKNVVLKVRKQQEGSSQYQKQDAKNYTNTVDENGLKFIINMYDYIDTGLFLDHRNTRRLIRKLASKRSFLNLFAYTGSVTVYAAAGGAGNTTTVDMSNTYLNWARANMELNGFTGSVYKGSQHKFIREDCLKWLQQAIDEKQQYQLIFVDPPTFSNSKKMDTSLDIKRDHVALLSGCLALLSDDGQIIFSTNARGFKLDKSLAEMCFVKDITNITTTEDFRRKPQHRCWCLVKQESLLENCTL